MIVETSSITMPRLVSSNYGACLSLHRHRRSCCPPSVLKAICYHSKHHHNGYCAMFNPADEPDTMLLIRDSSSPPAAHPFNIRHPEFLLRRGSEGKASSNP